MRYDADADGRYPLSTREYDALRTVFGAVNALDTFSLKDRCRLIRYGWRNLRLAQSLLKKTMEQLLSTIPSKKLLTIQRELRQTICEVKIKPPGGVKDADNVYVSQSALVRITERAIQLDCLICDKSAKECKKCGLYQDISACFPYELTVPEDTKCPFCGVSRLEVEEK